MKKVFHLVLIEDPDPNLDICSSRQCSKPAIARLVFHGLTSMVMEKENCPKGTLHHRLCLSCCIKLQAEAQTLAVALAAFDKRKNPWLQNVRSTK